MVRKSLQCSEIEIETSEVETVWCRMKTPDRGTLAIGSFYRPPGASMENIRVLDSVLASLPDDRIILAGDFNMPNLKWDENGAEETRSTFGDITSRYGLQQYVFTATRGDNILDLLFCNDPAIVREVCTLPGISDHKIVTAKFSLPQLTPPSIDVKKPLQPG